MQSKEVLKKPVDELEQIDGENLGQELTDEEVEIKGRMINGLRQIENEAEVFEKNSLPDDAKNGVLKGLKKKGAKVFLFLTLTTSMGAFTDKAEANEWGRAAGEGVERLFNNGKTIRQSRTEDNVMFNNYIRQIKTMQNEGYNWNKDASNAQRRNLNQKLKEIEYDKSLNYEQKMDAIERARRGQN